MIHCHSCIDRQRESEELKKRIEELKDMWRNAEDDNIRQSKVIVELRTRVEERKEWESGNRTMKMVWNEAIEAARKVAEKCKHHADEVPYSCCGQEISESINKLKKG